MRANGGRGNGRDLTVEVSIAVPAANRPVDAVGLGEITAETIDLDGVRVLIVDDHADSRDLFRRHPESAGSRGDRR